MSIYWQDEQVTLYLGDSREIVPSLGLTADLVMTDCPYGETSLTWDRWQDGWVAVAAAASRAMWCFGSMRMFLDHGHEFTAAGWSFAQDIVWEKHNGSGFAADRFKRVHEHALHWYQGEWRNQQHETPTTLDAVKHVMRRKERPTHMGEIAGSTYTSEDGGPRLMRSVIQVRSMRGRAIHPTEKPVGIIDPLIRYSTLRGGVRPGSIRRQRLDTDRRAGRWPEVDRHRDLRKVLRGRRPPPVAVRPGPRTRAGG